MAVALTRVASLEEAINQQISLGRRDSLEIADALIGLYSPEEILSWIDARAIVMDAARHRLADLRRSHEARAMRAPNLAERVKRMGEGLTRVLVPGVGVVRINELTADHCMARAALLRDLAQQNGAKAHLYESMASAIRGAGVDTLGELPEQALITFDGQIVELGEAA